VINSCLSTIKSGFHIVASSLESIKMPISQNPKETGWFYHAPEKKRVGAERAEYPAPSQIPGIGYEDPEMYEKEQVREMMFKDTDSKYIRMAKVGGRKDLLQFNPEMYGGKKSEEPKGYQRNDWFYLEDNRMEDQEKKEEEEKHWQFLLPEYMVHKGYQPSFENPETPPSRGSRAPYHTENMTEVEREARLGRSATDKTVRIPEVRKPGYGIRNEKPPQAHRPLPRDTDKAPKNRGRKTFSQEEKDDPTSMAKLLGGEYEREWRSKQNSATSQSKAAANPRTGSANRQEILSRLFEDMQPQQLKTQEEEKEMFKLSRFQNIPSKIDSHQRPELLAK